MTKSCTVEDHARAKTSSLWHTWVLHQRANPGDWVDYVDKQGRKQSERVYVAMELRYCPDCDQIVDCLVEHLPPIPTMPGLVTVGDLRSLLLSSGWVLGAGRRDGSVWATITKRNGEQFGAAGDDLNDVVAHVLQIAAETALPDQPLDNN